jgi:hypothetical protein
MYLVVAFVVWLLTMLLVGVELLLAAIVLLPQLYEIENDNVEFDGIGADTRDLARRPTEEALVEHGSVRRSDRVDRVARNNLWRSRDRDGCV